METKSNNNKAFIIVAAALLLTVMSVHRMCNKNEPTSQERAEQLVKEYVRSNSEAPDTYSPISFSDLYLDTHKELKASGKGYYDKVTGCFLDHVFTIDMGGFEKVKVTSRFYFDTDITRVTRDEVKGID